MALSATNAVLFHTALAALESGGLWRETYLTSPEADEMLAQSTEIWIRLSEIGTDWYIDSRTYDMDGNEYRRFYSRRRKCLLGPAPGDG